MGRVDVDKYLAKSFDLAHYNCWHLLREVWLELTGVDLGDRTPERITTNSLMRRFDTDVPTFQELAAPEDPSMVLMLRRGVIPHVGVYLRGRVLQMTSTGASYMLPEQACLGFDRVRYFR